MSAIKITVCLTLLLLGLLSCSSLAVELAYDVIGFADEFEVSGELIGNLEDTRVEGLLSDQNGGARYFTGDWIGNGEFEGYDENNEFYKLELVAD